MFCTKCGTKNSDTSQFCFSCGNSVSVIDTQVANTSQVAEAKPYISPYEDEETIFSIRGRNLPDKRVFPKDKKDIPLLNSPDCDIFYTNRRICLTVGDPNIKEPAPTKWFIPVGGGVGALANLALQGAINGYRKSQFKKKNGAFYEPAEIDIMCLAGNAIYSKGPVKIEIFKDKAGFFNTIGNDPKYMNIAFTGDYQYQDRIIKGSIIHVFTGDVNGTIKELNKLSLASVEISSLHRNDIENVKYISSKLS
jgi:hypothetical protein